jgi:pilus assembly protein CpaE
MAPLRQRGQSAVEIVAVAPLAVLAAAALGQIGAAAWVGAEAAGAATAAARAAAVGGDPARAARAELPAGLRSGLRVDVADGRATVRVRVPRLLPVQVPGLAEVRAEAGT